jgi:hypothetical protein
VHVKITPSHCSKGKLKFQGSKMMIASKAGFLTSTNSTIIEEENAYTPQDMQVYSGGGACGQSSMITF